jgi:hypothetical protein
MIWSAAVDRRSRTLASVAAGTAFGRSRDGVARASQADPRPLRIRRAWLAFTVGFPAAVGAVALAAALGRSGTGDGALALAVVLLSVAALLLVLGAASGVWLATTTLTIRFFGFRKTTVRLDELVSATFVMAMPSISYALVLRDRQGRKGLFHANWWDREPDVLVPVCAALLQNDVAMDRQTARVVAQTMRVKPPKARIVHHAFLDRSKTW